MLVQGFSNAREAMGPLSWNGFWQASIARQLVQVRAEDGVPGFVVPDEAIALARDAFATEPLATDALFVLATQNPQDDLVRLGLALDKRNRYLGMLEVQSRLLERDLAGALATIDRLSITHPRLLGEFLRPFTQALSQEGTEEILLEALESEPVWAEQFWITIPPDPTAVRKMYNLRQQIDFGTSADSDLRLTAALANARLYEEAGQFWSSLPAGQGNPTAFLPASDVEPFGWRVTTSGDRSFSARGEGAYQVFVSSLTFGELARQLVLLDPGTYRFSASVSPATERENLGVSLQCATTEADAPEPRPLTGPISWTIGGQCSAFWLILSGNAWESRSDLEARIEQLVLEKAD